MSAPEHRPGIYLQFRDRPEWFRAPWCDCTETCPECFREGRTIGRLSDQERADRLALMEVRMGRGVLEDVT